MSFTVPSFKTYVMFLTCILFHLKRFVCDKHSLLFKTLVMFTMHIILHLNCSYCLRHAISFIQNIHNVFWHKIYCTLHLAVTITYCSYIYSKVLSCIFKINRKNRNVIFVITEKCQILQSKILSLSNLSLFESETIFSKKIFHKEKKLLLWIYAWWLSGHLWFNGQRKLLVAGPNWNPTNLVPHLINRC